MIGLIDATNRFDEKRGIKFETFAERRVRGAMIDALRKDAWPRGVRRVRRELEAAREKLRHERGHEPSLADLAEHMGLDEARLGRTIVRINTIESTSPLATEAVDGANLPSVLVPSEPVAPDKACEEREIKNRVRAAISELPWRERKVVGLYYYGEVTMKEIGVEIGVNESRVSQLHARAIQRLRTFLGDDLVPENLRTALTDLSGMSMAKSQLSKSTEGKGDRFNQGNSVRGGVVVAYAEKPYRPASAIRTSRTPCEKNGSRRMFAAQ